MKICLSAGGIKLPKKFFQKEHQASFWLILAGSLLMAIWAVKDTIALRNTLLGTGAMCGLFYSFLPNKDFSRRIFFEFQNLFPLLLIFVTLIWMLFLALYVGNSFDSFSGTWLRCVLATIFGGSLGVVLIRNPTVAPLLWTGILLSFISILFQYLLVMDAKDSLYFIDWYGDTYLYIGKINAVLMGGLLIAGYSGSLLDLSKYLSASTEFFLLVLVIFSMTLMGYLFIFIFDSSSGVATLVALIFTLLIFNTIKFFEKKSKKIKFLFMLFFLASFLAASYFYVSTDDWWVSLTEDIRISSDVDKNLQWMQIGGHRNFPKRDSGEPVSGNVYERVSWGLIGLRQIQENPIGIGIPELPFRDLVKKNYPGATPFSSHSAWIELTLSFGWFFTFAIFLVFLINTVKALMKQNIKFKYSTLLLSFIMIITYSVGELNTKHGLEILFFMLSFMTLIQFNTSIEKTLY